MLRLDDCSQSETLCAGAESVLRRVVHDPSGERFLVKTPGSGAIGQRGLGRLLHELHILGKLGELPGVPRARTLEQDGHGPALWLLDRGQRPLDRILFERGPLPLVDALRLAFEVCLVLGRVHAAHIVHKDIRPQNIFCDENFQHVELFDFAIATELSEETTHASLPEGLEGVLAYISPEQTGRTARGLDARTDLYSLGVVLFELLAGRKPFLETDPMALVFAHLAKPVPALESLVPGLPSIVARIVERCLEKHPEKRYQTAKGLAADLEECRKQIDVHGTIEEFALGQKDFSPLLHLPQSLVSREKEAAEITAAVERAADGSVEVFLLGGPSGVGKTALVRSVYQQIAKLGRGLFLSGKHDQWGRSVPYAALAQAFGGLLRDIVGSPKSVFDAWKARFERGLGPLARIIADIVPEFEWLMGPIPPLPVVTTEMTYNRLRLSFYEFVRTITEASSPLVLFLDDMQWVDPASIEILKSLLTDVGKKNLLLLAAYRDNEVDSTHPLWKLIEDVEKAGVKTPRMTVDVFSESSVQHWLAAALSTELDRVSSLAKTFHDKTHGNPFFLGQLLLELHRQKRVRRNLDTGEWEWDQDAVREAAVTDNVVEFMGRKVVELPAETQTLLGQAACAGHRFTLAELAVNAGMTASAVVNDLRPALVSGLVIPEDGHYRDVAALAEAAQKSEIDAGYRFLHDRVQQAAYERLDLEQRTRTHLLIGQRLQDVFEKEGGSNQKLLELARHLNLGSSVLTSDAERSGLARVNLRSAKAAKQNGSYRLQATLVDDALTLLRDRAWTEEAPLAVELAIERIEANYMLKEFDEVHQRAQVLLSFPLPALPRLAAYELRVRAAMASGLYRDGMQIGMAALAEQGVTYPETDAECIMQAFELMGELDAWLDQNPDGFDVMPLDPSIEHFLGDAIEAGVHICALFVDRVAITSFGLLRNLKRIIGAAGLTYVTPYALSSVATVRSALLQDYRGDLRWAKLGENVARRVGGPFLSEISFFRGVYEVYQAHVEQSRVYYQAAVREGTAMGSFVGVGWGLSSELHHLDFWQGRPLGQVAENGKAKEEFLVRMGDATGQHCAALTVGLADFLCAPTGNARSTADEWLTTGSRFFIAAGDGLIAEFARIDEAFLFLAFGEWSRARERADEADQFRHTCIGIPCVTDIPLWQGLAAAKCWSPELAADRRAELVSALNHAITRFCYFSEGCADNFIHKLRLLEAEHARLHDNENVATNKYDEAIDFARKHGFLHIEALAAQFAAEYHLQRGRSRIAALYVHEAQDAYLRWEALALVAHLDATYADLLKSTSRPGASTTAPQIGIDVNTAIRAAQTLGSELDPDRVVARLMDLCMANAGAQAGALALVQENALVVVSRLSVKDERIETGLSIPLDQAEDLATTVLRYVARSREVVVVNHVASEKRFPDDPYLAAHRARSLLALPLMHRGHLVGVLYLEHRDANAAFPPSRVELLSVIASQAAIAVENANQVRSLEVRNREIQSLNDELRRQIAQRSRRLMDAFLSNDASGPVGVALSLGSVLGDCYRVVRLIGEGGMGAVYEVERTTDGKRLAAKVLNHSPERSDLGRFAREAQILASLSHPNLVAISDIDFTNEGVLYIVMELVSGVALREVETHVGDIGWSLQVLAQVAEALSALHAQSVIHRDLKPDNILVVPSSSGSRPIVKLADFGISIVQDDTRRDISGMAAEVTGDENTLRDAGRRTPVLTHTGMLVGTPFYMAPELSEGSRNAAPSSDIFSLGIIAFELLVGAKPFKVPAVYRGVVEESVPVGLRETAGLALDIAALLERCLEMDPEKRPAAAEIAYALGRIQPDGEASTGACHRQHRVKT